MRRCFLKKKMTMNSKSILIHVCYGLWDDGPIPETYQQHIQEFQKFGTVRIWLKHDIEVLLASEQVQNISLLRQVVDLSRHFVRRIQIADLVRLVVVYLFGGLYIDLDCSPTRDFEHDLENIIARSNLKNLKNANKFKHRGGHKIHKTHPRFEMLDNAVDPQENLAYFFIEKILTAKHAQDISSQHRQIRNGTIEHRVRVSNFIFGSTHERHSIFLHILELLYKRCRQSLSKTTDIDYMVLYTTGPDCVTEALLRIKHVQPANERVFLSKTKIVHHHRDGSWRNARDVTIKHVESSTAISSSLPAPGCSFSLLGPAVSTLGSQQTNVATVVAKQDLSSKTIVWLGLCRNSAESIQRLVDFIVSTSAPFRDYKIIVLESNSTDNGQTRSILETWRNKDSKRHVLLSENQSPSIKSRCKRMSFLRNMLLNEYINSKNTNTSGSAAAESIRKTLKNEYIAMIDLDIKGLFSASGFYDTFSRFEINAVDKTIGAIACMGLNVWHTKRLVPSPQSNCIDRANNLMYYDMYAFRSIRNKREWISEIHEREKLIHVNSAFGGLAVYRAELLFDQLFDLKHNCRYESPTNDCEHLWFHEQIRGNGYQIVINPKMLLWYVVPTQRSSKQSHLRDKMKLPYSSLQLSNVKKIHGLVNQ